MYGNKVLKYEIATTPKGNYYEIHSTHTGEELLKNKSIAAFLIDKYGGKLKLLPNNITNKEVANKIMPKNRKEGKFPDALWNGEIWEFKVNSTGRLKTLKQEIIDAHKQANLIVIQFDFDMPNNEIYRLVKGQILATQTLEKVWIIKNGKRYKYERKYLKRQKPQQK